MTQPFLRNKARGFTIIELLIVIIVIGILVTISIVSYNGLQQRGRDTAVLSDTDGVAGELVRYSTRNSGMYGNALVWYSPSGTNSNIQFTPTSGDIVDIVTSTTDYCIRTYNLSAATYKTLSTAATKESTPGVCATMPASVTAQVASGIHGTFVTTLAGSTAGAANGTGTAATFRGTMGIGVDTGGNIYVTDMSNHLIRKITPSAVVTTLAGSGTMGSANGTGTAASFSFPTGLAVDASGNVYIADGGNNLIRKITPAGVVTTFAGSGASGSTNGTGTAASFSYPIGIAVDSSNNVYVADNDFNLIRKITPAGVVTTLAGSGSSGSTNGTGTAASFNDPNYMSCDSTGNLYVAEQSNNLIRKITPAGVVTTLAGTGAVGPSDGLSTTATFNYPKGTAVSSTGIIYVSDGNTVRKIQTL
jgi:prepilin-type N-terminal cleavage/methylation domain-containing protein